MDGKTLLNRSSTETKPIFSFRFSRMGGQSSEATISSLVLANQDLVHIPCDYAVGQALAMLHSTGISWLPVGCNVDEVCSEFRALSYTDLLKSLVECNLDKATFLASPVVRAISTKHSILVHSKTSLSTCLDRMIHDRVYRLAIAEQQVLLHHLPQMDVLRFIYENRRAFLGDYYLRLRALQLHSLGSSPVVSLAEDRTVVEACSFMMARK